MMKVNSLQKIGSLLEYVKITQLQLENYLKNCVGGEFVYQIVCWLRESTPQIIFLNLYFQKSD